MLRANVITRVTAPSASTALTTLETVKAVLGISGATDDVYLTLAIGQASAVISTYCNRVFALETVEEAIRPATDNFPWNVPGSLPVQHDATIVVSPTQLGLVVPRVGDKVVVASRERPQKGIRVISG